MASSPRRIATGESGFPAKQGMYNPDFERDACGLAMVATLASRPLACRSAFVMGAWAVTRGCGGLLQ